MQARPRQQRGLARARGHLGGFAGAILAMRRPPGPSGYIAGLQLGCSQWQWRTLCKLTISLLQLQATCRSKLRLRRRCRAKFRVSSRRAFKWLLAKQKPLRLSTRRWASGPWEWGHNSDRRASRRAHFFKLEGHRFSFSPFKFGHGGCWP